MTSPTNPNQPELVAYLVEFENGERELHLAEDGVPSCGETVTPLYALPDPGVAP